MSRNKWFILALCALPVLAGCGGGAKEETASSEGPAEGASAEAPAAADAGGVNGTVTFAGQDSDTPIAMDADPICAGLHTTPVDTNEVAAKDGKLGNVFVYVKSGLTGSYPAPAEKKELDQVGCQYTPRVLGLQAGQGLVIKNTDATLHNVHALPKANAEFNQAQPQGVPPIEKTFDKAEMPPAQIKCDVHPWMTAYVAVVDNPFYAVSGEDGTFSIDKLPPGKYTLEAWHEKLGTKTQEVTIAPNQKADVTFAF
jgi:plastocyanin